MRRTVGPAVVVAAGAAAGKGPREADELVEGGGLPAETRRPGRRTGGLGSDPPPTTRVSCWGLEMSEAVPRLDAAVDAGEGRPVAEARERVVLVRAVTAGATGAAFCLPLADDEADGASEHLL
jgi:hypothetical protein